ncbi:alpha/beta fold hydrolase [Streptomyces sp. H10-C2]|uniref:alpha/beta fold hydrolase n=1 Tax=unclassified Streptomyces TaxID=2593676 RepID=UPI0024BA1E67|nr:MULTISPECIES: alpha/beta fold hydrolase [unclassified Streptomyces]MDJ0341892.1 alpha/beta fold hydrolase [Streptomyces sp. PH10-H1]MDJ0370354.1 alpha/beta fold hydrolase [Streptomyces sp. H10-C2]
MRHHQVTVDGVQLHYAEAGDPDAPPILLVHGFPQHWYTWRHVLPGLSGDYRLICLDMPGFGWSQESPDGYSTDRRAADLVAVLDALGLARVRLLAHDWGAWAGFLACARSPERFSHFLAVNMVHPWPTRRNTLRHAWRFWYTVLLEWPPLGRRVLRHWPAFTRYLLRRGVTDAATWQEGEIEEFATAAREPRSALAGERIHRAFVAHDIAALRHKEFHALRLTVPTLILAGERDVVIPPPLLEGGGAFADALSVEVVPGAGHFLQHERPDRVVAAARRLFAR